MERKQSSINNAFYDDLHEGWFTAENHPVALLRSENKIRNPWILEIINQQNNHPCSVLDIGCGAGLLTHFLSEAGHDVTGIDRSMKSLEMAQSRNDQAHYLYADATSLPFADHSFDVVCAMDLLEHVEAPDKVLLEASRTLKPGGLFFFHTFNRTWLSYLLVIKGVEWFVKNTPKNMHVYSLFITPDELQKMGKAVDLHIETIQGLVPDGLSLSFWKMLFTQKVPSDFRFVFSRSLKTGYVGYARKASTLSH